MLRSLPVLAVLLVILAPLTRADTVTGQVVDENGVGIANVVLEFNGGVVPVGNITDALGFFTTTVPADDYDITLIPPAGYVPIEIEGVTVLGSVSLGVLTLRFGVTMTGMMVDDGGLPVTSGDIDVFDANTGERVLTPGDGTDITGAFSVVVPVGQIEVRAEPASGSLLVARRFKGITVTGPFSLGTVVLETGFLLSGTVADSQTFAVRQDLDIDVFDAADVKVETPGDNTNAFGIFSVIVPAGVHRVVLQPAPGDIYAAREISGVVVTGHLNLGVLTVDPGFILTGTVHGPGATPVVATDIDVEKTLGGDDVFLVDDNTDASGSFSVIVPAGSFRLVVEPLFAEGLVGLRTAPFTVAANASTGTLVLGPGVVLSGTVSGPGAAPEVGADIDVVDPVTGDVVVTPADDTDGTGAYAVLVPSGTWDVNVSTREGSLSGDQGATGVVVAAATVRNFALARVAMFCGLTTPLPGDPPTIAAGTSMLLSAVLYNPNATPRTAVIDLTLIDPAGGVTPLIVPGTLSLPPGGLVRELAFPLMLPASGAAGLGFGRTLPPVQAAHLGCSFDVVLRASEVGTGAEIDRSVVKIVIQ